MANELQFDKRSRVMMRMAMNLGRGTEFPGPACTCGSKDWRYDGPVIIDEDRNNSSLIDFLGLHYVTCNKGCGTTRTVDYQTNQYGMHSNN